MLCATQNRERQRVLRFALDSVLLFVEAVPCLRQPDPLLLLFVNVGFV